MDPDSRQFGKQRFQLGKDPLGQVFAGRVLQAWYVVQVVVIKSLIERLENRLNLREVTDPADMRIDFAFQMNSNAERMAVQPSAFMTFWDMGEEVG